MVRIRDFLHDDLVVEQIKATDKTGVINEFSELLRARDKVRDSAELVRVLLDREALGTTGIGDGVAIPHGKLRGLSEMVIAFGRSSQGVDFEALDGKPVSLFFLLVTPDDDPGGHLKTLARISRLLKSPSLRENLRHAAHKEEIQRLIFAEDDKYPNNEG